MNLQPNAWAPIDNTSLMGTIQATPDQLEKAFGEPEVNHLEDKVPVIWTLVDADIDKDRVVATVYLWKKPIPNNNEVTTWNIGGHSLAAVAQVHNAFRVAHGLSANVL